MKYRSLVLLFSLFFVSLCFAEVYRTVDQKGNITYSDSPSGKNSEIVNLPPDSSHPSSNATMNNNTENTASDNASPPSALQLDRKPYTEFSFKSPTDQETIHNQPIINVDFNLKPELQKGDLIQLYMDGAAFDKPVAATHFELKTIDRGTHQLYGVLMDANKTKLAQTMIITIYVHQASLGPANRVVK